LHGTDSKHRDIPFNPFQEGRMATKKAEKKKTTKKGTKKGRKKSAEKTGKKKAKRKAAKRERISPRGDARYVRRNANGEFDESDDVGRSQAADRRKKAKRSAKPGQGDKGDRKISKKKK
jgi:hypothetical protein